MSFVGDTFNGLGLWITRRERKQEKDDDAIRSLLDAVNATKLYIARLERGDRVDRKTEEKLVDLWTAAAVHIRRTDQRLATRLQTKALYWTNPDYWTLDEIIGNGISLELVADEANRLLLDV